MSRRSDNNPFDRTFEKASRPVTPETTVSSVVQVVGFAVPYLVGKYW